MRSAPRSFLAGLAFGASVLMHPWMGPIVVLFCAVWIIERRFSGGMQLVLGALPSIILLTGYNVLTTGNPFRSVYTILGVQNLFNGSNFLRFLVFYVASLTVFPIAGWSVFSRRCSGTYALPAAGAVTLVHGFDLLLPRRLEFWFCESSEYSGGTRRFGPRATIPLAPFDDCMPTGCQIPELSGYRG